MPNVQQAIRLGEKMKMAEYISRKAAIAYIREQSEECQKAFEELGGESGIYADAYNDLAEDFYSIPAADVAQVVHGMWETNSDRPDTLICSICKCGFDMWKHDPHNYCPNCGSKMDLEALQ
jgi:rubrerythrin